ncbi:MAG: MarR family transcriptional regulator [Clostridiales bacterium]|nr:MarR family transcriptional regulator [Clostridiales bacterium]
MNNSSDNKYLSLKLENQICFHLYACARETIKHYTPLLADLDLTYTQYLVMLVLWEKKSLTVKELGGYLYLDSGTLTPLLKKMEAKGFLSRTKSNEDGRNLIVATTKKGERLKEKAAEIPYKLQEIAKLPEEDVLEFRRIIHTLMENVAKNQE